jgi:hypothetical protein
MSRQASKKSISKNKSLFKEINKKQDAYKQRKSVSLNNMILITKKKFNLNEPSKKVINVVDFIKQKKNFLLKIHLILKVQGSFWLLKKLP